MVSKAGIDIGTMIVGIISITTGTIITIGTTTGIATVATSTSMTTTSVESEWDGLISLNFETNALALCRSRGAAKNFLEPHDITHPLGFGDVRRTASYLSIEKSRDLWPRHRRL